MTVRNPRHPRALARGELEVGMQIIWCNRKRQVIRRAEIVKLPDSFANPEVVVRISWPESSVRNYALNQMGVVPFSEGTWCPDFTLRAEDETTLSPEGEESKGIPMRPSAKPYGHQA